MVLIDTCVLIDYTNDKGTSETAALERILANRIPIFIGDLILMELLQGAKTEIHAAAIMAAMAEFQILQIAGADCAVQAASYFRTLRRMGITVRKIIDCLIATRCIHDNLILLSSDRDFAPFETHFGLRRVAV
jgi:predicted nucleic acid-binding protein